ncbi:peroxidase family protein [Ferirhizobium litorale]|uniref:Heme peroxidase family protein n=1 Tax=Ferirhizobium litorale TaxID=2927786 RepID=A0AAE3QD49_9HYPH|nr:heme peroxidase family protein [Fererhizobium litorale]MDI7922960.1 heme peroxidase family protein [Fererhizobium litorale]
MQHGVKDTFEVSGEKQVIAGVSLEPEGQGFRFGRIFGNLPPYKPTDTSLAALGATMTTAKAPSDSSIPAGYTYFGQFIDHDITLDGSEGLPQDLKDGISVDDMKQLRSPSLDLDSVYGWADTGQTFRHPDGLCLRLGHTTGIQPPAPTGPGADVDVAGHDVPRRANGEADISDPRNDENLIIQQIHNAFLRFHNKVAAELRAAAHPTVSNAVIFAQARDLVTRHYQWLVLGDFVRRIVDANVFDDVLGIPKLDHGRQVTPNPLIFKVAAMQTPPMPLEFSAAAFRLGHPMVRDGYSWNKIFGDRDTSFALFFQFTHLSGIVGGSGLPTFPSNWIADWRRMFPLEDVAGFPPFVRGSNIPSGEIPLNLASKIDTSLAEELGRLPKGGGNLAARNLVRGSRNGLPSGQDVAAEIIRCGDKKTKILTPDEILNGLDDNKKPAVTNAEFHMKTPLWFYILREAEIAGGDNLGRVGSRIVLETFLALIRCSLTSIFAASAAHPGKLDVFSPQESPLRTPGGEPILTMAHLLAYVGDVNPLGD